MEKSFPMEKSLQYSIKVYKQYFNFAASHFLLFEDGSREPLHGHNYRVMVKGDADQLNQDMVFDFLDIKPIVREVCDALDHKLLIPKLNERIKIYEEEKNYIFCTQDNSTFHIPKQDVLLLPIQNTSAERIAAYLCQQIIDLTWQRFQFKFKSLEIEVEETPGQSAVYIHQNQK